MHGHMNVKSNINLQAVHSRPTVWCSAALKSNQNTESADVEMQL